MALFSPPNNFEINDINSISLSPWPFEALRSPQALEEERVRVRVY
jgi:hypothetical protein